ncbi:MAG TPA: hypothetical protein VJ276_26590 [Thermoanaerobaculia bacterium]|nr:hypothetical protein [Thermoanaerobaculia bacterium]
MRIVNAVAVAIVTLSSFACATQYRSSDTSLTGGFTEIRLAPNQWRVLVEGNGFTTRGEAEQFLLRRCAELTLEQGKRYFVLDGHDAWLNAWRSRSGVQHTAPANSAVVTALDESEQRAFDAAQIVAETNDAAGGKLSDAARHTLELVAPRS